MKSIIKNLFQIKNLRKSAAAATVKSFAFATSSAVKLEPASNLPKEKLQTWKNSNSKLAL